MALQSALRRPELVSIGATAWARLLSLRGSTRHFEAALVPAGVDGLGDLGQRESRSHARQIRHVPLKAVDLGHDVMVDAAVGRGLDDDLQDVDADREMARDIGAVLVVARVRPQLGDAGIEIADLQIAALDQSDRKQAERGEDTDRGASGPGQRSERPVEPRQVCSSSGSRRGRRRRTAGSATGADWSRSGP